MRLEAYVKEIRRIGRRSFTLDDVVERFGIPREQARVEVHTLKKMGDVISPCKGFYVIVPPECQPYGSIPAQDLIPLIAEHMKIDYYVALLSAGLYHGATHQKPNRFQVISDKRIKRKLVFGKVVIEFIYKKDLKNLPLSTKPVSTGYIKISSPELTALDLLTYSHHSGGLNHIATVLAEMAQELDAEKLVELACQTNMEYQIQRIGYILENIDLYEEEIGSNVLRYLADFVKGSSRKMIPLLSIMPIKGAKKSEKWKIIINSDMESDI